MTDLVSPPADGDAALAWVRTHLSTVLGPDNGRSVIRGGQTAADAALAAWDVTGYAADRNEVWPAERRGASGLSPYVRHGLLPLKALWDAVAGGPDRDVRRFRDELLWQEYARHLYARTPARRSLRFAVPERTASYAAGDPWAGDLACVTLAVDELQSTGWLPNQARLWLAGHWSVRHHAGWRDGEDRFFRYLLDGSRAANRLGWQWTVGALTGRPYAFTRHQVENRAPGLCAACPRRDNCPIDGRFSPPEPPPLFDGPVPRDVDAGPTAPDRHAEPDVVWLTAESLGADEPALAAHPDLPVRFVFDAPLLARLRLSSQRLVFLAEALGELAQHRDVRVALGDPVEILRDTRPAVTAAPVPGFRRRAERLSIAELHPWPWLVRPRSGPAGSFTAWRRGLRLH